ncbi:zinc finger protein 468-like isoform X1 [Centruroides vittatus]|uniref:zinc finger protein 468-like isoform X1 n=1 Tax=Centruroides vittatus TaxID=120091 RepID=UPI00350F3EBE
MSKSLRKCHVKFCENTTANCNLSFFSPPKDPIRSEVWFRNLPIETLVKRKYVCSDHFRMEAFTDTTRRRLHKFAVPEVWCYANLPDFIEERQYLSASMNFDCGDNNKSIFSKEEMPFIIKKEPVWEEDISDKYEFEIVSNDVKAKNEEYNIVTVEHDLYIKNLKNTKKIKKISYDHCIYDVFKFEGKKYNNGYVKTDDYLDVKPDPKLLSECRVVCERLNLKIRNKECSENKSDETSIAPEVKNSTNDQIHVYKNSPNENQSNLAKSIKDPASNLSSDNEASNEGFKSHRRKDIHCNLYENYQSEKDLKNTKIKVKTRKRSPTLKRHRSTICKMRMKGKCLIMHPKKKYKCKICKKVFSYYLVCKIHVYLHRGNRPFNCNICKEKFFFKCYLKQHKMRHLEDDSKDCKHYIKQFKCILDVQNDHKYCSDIPESSLLQYEKCNYEESPPCDVSDESCKEESKLFCQESCVVEKYFKCEICRKNFRKKCYLNIHKRSHSIRRIYKCRHCPRIFNMKKYLIRHRERHSKLKTYQCEICKKNFRVRQQLIYHQKFHSEGMPFECNSCKKSFKRWTDLQHAEARPFRCKICGERFGTCSEFATHEKLHSNKRPLIVILRQQ